MRLDLLLFCSVLLFLFVDVICLIFYFSGLFVVNFSFSSFVIFFWFISLLTETNRTPAEFTEGESELVSDFIVCGGGGEGGGCVDFFGRIR